MTNLPKELEEEIINNTDKLFDNIIREISRLYVIDALNNEINPDKLLIDDNLIENIAVYYHYYNYAKKEIGIPRFNVLNERLYNKYKTIEDYNFSTDNKVMYISYCAWNMSSFTPIFINKLIEKLKTCNIKIDFRDKMYSKDRYYARIYISAKDFLNLIEDATRKTNELTEKYDLNLINELEKTKEDFEIYKERDIFEIYERLHEINSMFMNSILDDILENYHEFKLGKESITREFRIYHFDTIEYYGIDKEELKVYAYLNKYYNRNIIFIKPDDKIIPIDFDDLKRYNIDVKIINYKTFTLEIDREFYDNLYFNNVKALKR